jgi:hypothetical protein
MVERDRLRERCPCRSHTEQCDAWSSTADAALAARSGGRGAPLAVAIVARTRRLAGTVTAPPDT